MAPAKREKTAQGLRIAKPSIPVENDERSVAGALINDAPAVLREIADLGLTPDHFIQHECRRVFGAVERLVASQTPLEPQAIVAEAGIGIDVAEKLTEEYGGLYGIGYHATRLSDAYLKRQAKAMLNQADGITAMRMAMEKWLSGLPKAEGECLSLIADEWLTSEPPEPDYIIEGLFEVKSRVMLIGASKTKKSFAALQLAVCVATGVDFVGCHVPKPRRVLLVNFENPEQWQHRRFRNMAATLKLASTEGRLAILNARGKPVDLAVIEAEALRHKAELVLIDPVYKIPDAGEENDQEKRMALIAKFDALGERTGATVLYTHHDPKGDSASRGIRDRGSGSNILNRDVDCTLTLDRWGKPDDPDAANLTVLDVLTRNAKEEPERTLCFNRGAFFHDPDREPFKARPMGRHPYRKPEGDPQADAQKLAEFAVNGDAKTMTEIRDHGKSEMGDQRTRRALDELKGSTREYGVTIWTCSKTRKGFIGSASAVRQKLQDIGVAMPV